MDGFYRVDVRPAESNLDLGDQWLPSDTYQTTRRCAGLSPSGSPVFQSRSLRSRSSAHPQSFRRVEVSFTDSDVYAIDVATGKTTNLTPHVLCLFAVHDSPCVLYDG